MHVLTYLYHVSYVGDHVASVAHAQGGGGAHEKRHVTMPSGKHQHRMAMRVKGSQGKVAFTSPTPHELAFTWQNYGFGDAGREFNDVS